MPTHTSPVANDSEPIISFGDFDIELSELSTPATLAAATLKKNY